LPLGGAKRQPMHSSPGSTFQSSQKRKTAFTQADRAFKANQTNFTKTFSFSFLNNFNPNLAPFP
jgi:hypothetical protein